MYKGFQITLAETNFTNPAYLHELGNNHLLENKGQIEEQIDSFILADGFLDGSLMQENWFPQINADVFISHSHHDEELAIIFAGWLYETFGLTAFIDSCVWGYANDLLREIDNSYCRRQHSSHYDYNKRNYSTSHVHMMLSVALSQMIDNTECLFFINTPHSITTESVIQQTESPWIYMEISMSQLIRRKCKKEHRIHKITESFSDGGKLQVKYYLPTEHLISIDYRMLSHWERAWNSKSTVGLHMDYPQYTNDLQYHALDGLYDLTK